MNQRERTVSCLVERQYSRTAVLLLRGASRDAAIGYSFGGKLYALSTPPEVAFVASDTIQNGLHYRLGAAEPFGFDVAGRDGQIDIAVNIEKMAEPFLAEGSDVHFDALNSTFRGLHPSGAVLQAIIRRPAIRKDRFPMVEINVEHPGWGALMIHDIVLPPAISLIFETILVRENGVPFLTERPSENTTLRVSEWICAEGSIDTDSLSAARKACGLFSKGLLNTSDERRDLLSRLLDRIAKLSDRTELQMAFARMSAMMAGHKRLLAEAFRHETRSLGSEAYDRRSAARVFCRIFGEPNFEKFVSTCLRLAADASLGTEIRSKGIELLWQHGVSDEQYDGLDKMIELLRNEHNLPLLAQALSVRTLHYRARAEDIPELQQAVATFNIMSEAWHESFTALSFLDRFAPGTEGIIEELLESERIELLRRNRDAKPYLEVVAWSEAGRRVLLKRLRENDQEFDVVDLLGMIRHAIRHDGPEVPELAAIAEAIAMDESREYRDRKNAYHLVLDEFGTDDAVDRYHKMLLRSGVSDRIPDALLTRRFHAMAHLPEIEGLLEKEADVKLCRLALSCFWSDRLTLRPGHDKDVVRLLQKGLLHSNAGARQHSIRGVIRLIELGVTMPEAIRERIVEMLRSEKEWAMLRFLAEALAAITEGKFQLDLPNDESGNALDEKAVNDWWRQNAEAGRRRALQWVADTM